MTSHGDRALDVVVAERACERVPYEYARRIDRRLDGTCRIASLRFDAAFVRSRAG